MGRVAEHPAGLPTEWGDLYRRRLLDLLRSLFSGLYQAQEQAFCIVCSDETTALTTGTAKVTYHFEWAFDITDMWIELATPQASGSTFTVDVNRITTSIISTKLTIDNTEETSLTAATRFVFTSTDVRFDKGEKLTVDIDQIGNGSAKGLKLHIVGVRV